MLTGLASENRGPVSRRHRTSMVDIILEIQISGVQFLTKVEHGAPVVFASNRLNENLGSDERCTIRELLRLQVRLVDAAPKVGQIRLQKLEIIVPKPRALTSLYQVTADIDSSLAQRMADCKKELQATSFFPLLICFCARIETQLTVSFLESRSRSRNSPL